MLIFVTSFCFSQSGNWIKESNYYIANPDIDPQSIIRFHNLDTNFFYISGYTSNKDIYITQLNLETAEIIKSDTIIVFGDSIKNSSKYKYSIDINDDMTICSYSWFRLIDTGDNINHYETYYGVFGIKSKTKIFEDYQIAKKGSMEAQLETFIRSFKSDDGKNLLITYQANWIRFPVYQGNSVYYSMNSTYLVNLSDLSKVFISNYLVDKPVWDFENGTVSYIIKSLSMNPPISPLLFAEYNYNENKIFRTDTITRDVFNYFDAKIIHKDKILFAKYNKPQVYSLKDKKFYPTFGNNLIEHSFGIFLNDGQYILQHNYKNVILNDFEKGNQIEEFTFSDNFNTSPFELKGKKGIVFRCNQALAQGKCNSVFKLIKPHFYNNIDTVFFNISSNKVRTVDTVKFNSTIIGQAKSIKWDFGDGSFSFEKDPNHQYLDSGNYTVSLEVDFDYKKIKLVKEDYIRVDIGIVPNFELDPAIGFAPAKVKIINKTEPKDDPNSILWTSNGTANENDPYLYFENVGIYNIQFDINNAYGYYYHKSQLYKVLNRNLDKINISKQNIISGYSYPYTYANSFSLFFKDNSNRVNLELKDGDMYSPKYHWLDVNQVDSNGNNRILYNMQGITEFRNFKTRKKIYLGKTFYDYISSDTIIPLIYGFEVVPSPYAVSLDDSGRVAILKLNSKGDKYDFLILSKHNNDFKVFKPEFQAWFTHTNSLANAYSNGKQDGFYLSRLVKTSDLTISKIDYEGKVIKDYLIPDEYGSQFIINVTMNQVGNELYVFYLDFKKRQIFVKINLETGEIYKKVLYSDMDHPLEDFQYIPDDIAVALFTIDSSLAIRYYDLKENQEKTYILKYLKSTSNRIYWDSSNVFYIVGILPTKQIYFGKIELLDIPKDDTASIDTTPSITPKIIELGDIFPNPISKKINLKFILKESTNLKFSIYDINGLKIKTLKEEIYSIGEYNESFDINLNEFSSDSFYFVVESLQGIVTKKLIVVK